MNRSPPAGLQAAPSVPNGAPESANATLRSTGNEPDEVTEEAIRSRAKALILRKGWQPGNRLGLHSVVELMTALGMDLSRDPETDRCAFPDCGCEADAICAVAIPAAPTTPDAAHQADTDLKEGET